jgi:hypothetical protein
MSRYRRLRLAERPVKALTKAPAASESELRLPGLNQILAEQESAAPELLVEPG